MAFQSSQTQVHPSNFHILRSSNFPTSNSLGELPSSCFMLKVLLPLLPHRLQYFASLLILQVQVKASLFCEIFSEVSPLLPPGLLTFYPSLLGLNEICSLKNCILLFLIHTQTFKSIHLDILHCEILYIREEKSTV